MKYRTVRVAALAAVGLGLALTQQACASGVTVSSEPTAVAPAVGGSEAPSPSASGPVRSGKTGQPISTGNGGSGQTGSTVAVCRSKDVKVDVNYQPHSDGETTRKALVALTNSSGRTCKVDGRVAISLVNAADEVVDVPVKEVDEPGEAVPITLKPGRTAFEGIKWTVCDKSDSDCGVGNTLRYNLEASTDGPVANLIGFPAPEKSNITMKSLSIGTLQPSTQGVVVW
ncbi:DUF4232 domain-containing protein [Krasilnikovia sp. MM14-A1004]|uniref:DUF4232 domain-containing protein n=1 Tax=Krasilnikovia sp. MM14-A1004 TaxID=3373541 RepID=UPI00399C94F5